MILDATAGNRTMWRVKQRENIIYIDIERLLRIKPTIYADNTQTPFLDKSFSMIIYDPPHNYGEIDNLRALYPSEVKRQKEEHGSTPFTYYGWDKYKTKLELKAHIWKALQEFSRILTDDGMLIFKWCELAIPMRNISSLFEGWQELINIEAAAKKHTLGKHQTYWLFLSKKKMELKQTDLLQF
jgi:hypothetical protein